GFRTHRGQMRRNGLAPLLQLMHNRSPLPTFHDEQQTQGQTEHETAEGQEQFVPQAKRLERKKARQASTTALDWWRRRGVLHRARSFALECNARPGHSIQSPERMAETHTQTYSTADSLPGHPP